MRLGCNHAFTLRPNLQQLFEDLDQEIQMRLAKTTIRYKSQIDLLQFDIKKDFINCDAIYWIDGDHFSPAGRKRFGKRVTLEKLLQP
jgi:lysophospholipase L1-like esterase